MADHEAVALAPSSCSADPDTVLYAGGHVHTTRCGAEAELPIGVVAPSSRASDSG